MSPGFPDSPTPQPPAGLPRFRGWPIYRQNHAPATIAIVASCVAVYLVQLYYFHFHRSEWPAELLAFSPTSFLEGRYWEIISYAWIHSVELPIHILFNMLMVWMLGAEVERTLGTFRYLIIYLGGAVMAALAFWAWSAAPWVYVAGASGSAFALITSIAVLYPSRRVGVLLFFIIPMRMKLSTLAWVACGIEMICAVFNILPDISHTAHLGGALFGLIATYILKPSLPPQPPPLFPAGFFPPR